jgi:trigger factor
LTSSLKTISPVVTELTIEVSKEQVAKAVDQAFAKLGRTASIRGFRKGKAPRSILRRMFGDGVLAEVRGDLVGSHLQGALREHDLTPLSQPEVDAGFLDESKAFTFTVKFENRPKLEAINYSDIELERYRIDVKKNDVEQEVERLRSSLAEVVDLEEQRPAAKGDFVKIRLKKWVEGEWKDAAWPEQEVVLGEGRIDSKIDDAVVGMNVNDEKVVDFGSESDLDDERIRYMVILVSVRGRRLPEVDDELAKDLGDYDSLDALRKSIEERIRKYGERTEDRRVRNAFFEALRKKNEMELPPSLVEQQTEALELRVKSSLAMLGDKSPGEKEEEEMLKRARSAADEIVHQHLLVLECARIENIEVKEDEIDDALAEIAEENGFPLPMVRAEYAKQGRREELKHQLLEKKIFNLALQRVKIAEVDPPAAAPVETEGQ